MLRVGTLFSGIGSPEKALKDLGIDYELQWFCEVDKHAVKSYCAIHGEDERKNLGDITKVWGRGLRDIDLLVWGFPCQSISIAGKQEGVIEGKTRSGLYYEGLRILKETRPTYSIIENVKNLTSKKFSDTLANILLDLEELGYNNYLKVLNAKDYGIPQNRERVFIVSILKDQDKETFRFPEKFDNGLRLKDMLEAEVDEKYYISEEKTSKLIMSLEAGEKFHNQDFSYAIDANYYKGPSQSDLTNGKRQVVVIPGVYNQKDGFSERDTACTIDASCYKGLGCNQNRNAVAITDTNKVMTLNTKDENGKEPPQQDRVYSAEGCMTALSAQLGGRFNVLENEIIQVGKLEDMNGHDICKRVYSEEGCSPTIPTGQSGNTMPKVLRGYRIRRLTPKECFRLMGFTDEDFEKAKAAGVSDAQLYKQAGNSIVTNVLYYIFKNLLEVHNEN